LYSSHADNRGFATSLASFVRGHMVAVEAPEEIPVSGSAGCLRINSLHVARGAAAPKIIEGAL